MAYGTLAFDEAISEKRVVRLDRAERLAGLPLLDQAILPKTPENFLDDGGVVGSRSTVEDVEVEAEPVINPTMQGVVLGTERRGVYALFESLGFRGSSVFILLIPGLVSVKRPRGHL